MYKTTFYKYLRIIAVIAVCCGPATKGFAQDELFNEIGSKFIASQKNTLTEELFVHLNKSFYVAGEIIWFKIYHLNKAFSANASNVGYVELLDRNSLPVLRTKIELDSVGGDGSLQLPLSLSSDYYVMRVYTQWMRNEGPEHSFEKTIAIVNPLKRQGVQQNRPAGTGQIRFFPEGGNIVSDLPVKVGFELQDLNGRNTNGKGVIIDDHHDTIALLNTALSGMGNFMLTPQRGRTYKALVTLTDGSTIISALPEVSDRGYVFSLEEVENEKVKITVRTNSQTSYPEVYVVAHSRQQIIEAKRNILTAGITTFYFDKHRLPEGVSAFTLFSSEKQPLCERLYFKQPIPTSYVSTVLNKDQYGTRENVSLSVLPAMGDSLATMSLSVYHVDSLQAVDDHNIASYFWLESELSGSIEQPSYYLTSTSPEVKVAIDNLMLIHGWRRFKWEPVSNTKQPVMHFPLERDGHFITAKVTDTRTQMPAQDIQVFLSIPDARYKLYTSKSDKNGLARFVVKDMYGAGEIVLQTNTQRDSFYSIALMNPFADEHSVKNLPLLKLRPSQQGVLTQYSIGMQSQHVYNSDSIQRFIIPLLTDTLNFYGTPEHSYKLDDYTRFTTMEEVLREYVREINVGVKGRGALKLKLWNEDKRELFAENILVVLDGVPLFNADKVFSYDPLKFKKIDIISRNYVFGSSIFNALAHFTTYQENYEGLELDPKAVAIDYEGLQLKREFYSPSYATEALKTSRIPDYRNTLYWAPNLKAGLSNFYTSDLKGQYVAVVQGISKQGTPFVSYKFFEVR